MLFSSMRAQIDSQQIRITQTVVGCSEACDAGSVAFDFRGGQNELAQFDCPRASFDSSCKSGKGALAAIRRAREANRPCIWPYCPGEQLGIEPSFRT